MRSHDERVGVNMIAGGRCRGDDAGGAGDDCDKTDEKSRKTCSSACINCSSPSPSTSTHWKNASLHTPPSQNTRHCTPAAAESTAQRARQAALAAQSCSPLFARKF